MEKTFTLIWINMRNNTLGRNIRVHGLTWKGLYNLPTYLNPGWKGREHGSRLRVCRRDFKKRKNLVHTLFEEYICRIMLHLKSFVSWVSYTPARLFLYRFIGRTMRTFVCWFARTTTTSYATMPLLSRWASTKRFSLFLINIYIYIYKVCI